MRQYFNLGNGAQTSIWVRVALWIANKQWILQRSHKTVPVQWIIKFVVD
jgi:hypothetical protein